jgi:hypothetical protein
MEVLFHCVAGIYSQHDNDCCVTILKPRESMETDVIVGLIGKRPLFYIFIVGCLNTASSSPVLPSEAHPSV